MPEVTFVADIPQTLASPDTGPVTSRIQIAELGKFSDPRYGDFGITQADVDSWRRLLSEEFQGRVPIDIDHHTDKGISSEAAGWITSIEQDGTRVFASVEWTPLGVDKVSKKLYRYISPTFTPNLKDKTGRELGPALLRAALVNNPFLRAMPAVSLSAAAVFALRVDEDAYWLADFTQDQRDALAAKGEALPDGSFPIRNKADLENAVHAYGRAKNQTAAKAHIVKRARALGATDMLPADWTTTMSLDAPVPIGAGDRVAESFGDLSLGKTGTVVRVHVQDIELEAGGPTVGVYVHDVVWDDGTRSEAVREHALRCLTPYRSLAVSEIESPPSPEPDLAVALKQLAEALAARPATT